MGHNMETVTYKIIRLLKSILPISIKLKLKSLTAKVENKGVNVYIHPTVQIIGASNVSIGDNTCISEFTWINANHRIKDEIEVCFGKNCFIGRRNFFSSGQRIEIGPYTLTTIECKFICSTHIADNPLVPYIAAGTTYNHSIKVGANCFFGVGATVLGNVTIGCGSIIGTGSIVTRDIPPFSIAIGNPAKVIKMYSFSRSIWIDIDSIREDDLVSNPDEQKYIQLLSANYKDISMPIIAAGSNLGNL
jgi:acetyltransferase-like isoleucine patch superfamily enzyme